MCVDKLCHVHCTIDHSAFSALEKGKLTQGCDNGQRAGCIKDRGGRYSQTKPQSKAEGAHGRGQATARPWPRGTSAIVSCSACCVACWCRSTSAASACSWPRAAAARLPYPTMRNAWVGVGPHPPDGGGWLLSYNT